jgi:hypothetical protein
MLILSFVTATPGVKEIKVDTVFFPSVCITYKIYIQNAAIQYNVVFGRIYSKVTT